MAKYQIFISSTYEDLVPERDRVIQAVLEMGHIPVGMEMFSAADEQQWQIIKRQIDESDYYVVLIAHRYGSMDAEVSYTEKEYDYALSKKLPILGFVLDGESEWPDKWIENNKDIRVRLDNFRSKVSSKMVSFWKTPEDLYGRCGIALMKAFSAYPREGWVRASRADTSHMTTEITRLSSENGRLRVLLDEANSAATDTQQRKINEVIAALRKNNRTVHVWEIGEKDWGDGVKTSLLEIFESIAPDLLDEASYETIADALAIHFSGANYRQKWPVPTNHLRYYIGDLVSLDLVTNSSKRHSVQDTEAYWMLTDFGRDAHSRIRQNELLHGVSNFDEAPQMDDNVTELAPDAES